MVEDSLLQNCPSKTKSPQHSFFVFGESFAEICMKV